MKLLVVNGSPKGDYSITLQTLNYLEILHPEHEFARLNAGAKIRSIEKDFSESKKLLEEADLIVFAYPVYTFITPSQLHRFIELMKENSVDIRDKFVTQLSTSKHFYDVTAHKFIEENMYDMGAKYIKGLSADMDDLTKDQGQKDAEDFFDYVIWCMEHNIYEALPEREPDYVPVKLDEALTGPDMDEACFELDSAGNEKSGDVVIVADLRDDDVQLKSMINCFRKECGLKTRLVNLREFPFKGGCISCFNCAADGQCIYTDGFDSFLRGKIQTAQAIVLAFSIKDHSMGSLFKTYDDRQFCNGHRTVTMGMPFAYIISGRYSAENNLQTIIEGRAEVGHNFLAGIATDEKDPAAEIKKTAEKLEYAATHHYVQPQNFLGVGGMKIFRDLIWQMQGLMKADHKFYKTHGQYDFPQKHRGRMIAMYGVGMLMGNKKLMAKAGNNVKEGMIAPYKKVLEQTKALKDK